MCCVLNVEKLGGGGVEVCCVLNVEKLEGGGVEVCCVLNVEKLEGEEVDRDPRIKLLLHKCHAILPVTTFYRELH